MCQWESRLRIWLLSSFQVRIERGGKALTCGNGSGGVIEGDRTLLFNHTQSSKFYDSYGDRYFWAIG